MKPIQTTTFLVIFVILVFLETVIANLEGFDTLHFISKPLILSALITYFWLTTKPTNKRLKQLTLMALFFSLVGDVLLLFVFKSEFFFIGGLLAFLVAHILYCLLFLNQRNSSLKPYGVIVLFAIYAIGLFAMLYPGLGDLLIPVIVYMLVIILMGVTAYLRKENVSSLSFKLVFIGALLFMLSDSILALNKFYTPIPYSSFSIMLSYALAQLLIVLGIKKQLE